MRIAVALSVLVLFVFSSFGQKALESLLSIDQSKAAIRKNVFTNINISREYFAIGNYDQGAAYAVNNLCTEYTEMSWYSEALHYRLKSLEYFQNKMDTTMIVHTMIRIGYINDRIGEYETSLSWYKKAEPIALNFGDTLNIADVYAYRGIAYDELGMYDSVHYYNQKAIELFLAIEEMYAYSIWCSNIGNTYIKQKNFNKAEEFLLKSLSSSPDDIGDDKAIKLINLSKVYYHYEDYRAADSTLLLGLDYAKKFSQFKFISEAYLTYSEELEKRGLDKKPLECYKLFKLYEDSTFNEEKSNQIAYHNAKFNTQQKEKELLLQKNKNQKLENQKLVLDLELSERNNWILSLLGVLVFALFSADLMVQRNKRKLEREKSEALLT